MAIFLGAVGSMIVFDICLHVADLWAIRKTGQRLILFKTWKGYNAFWLTFWIVALVLLIAGIATR